MHMQTPFDDLLARLWIMASKPGERSTKDINEAKNAFDQLAQVLKNTTNRLERSERRLRTLVESIPIGLLVTSQEGRIEVTNKGGLALLSCKIDDIVGRQLSEVFTANGGATLEPDEGNTQSKEAIANRPNGSHFESEMVVRSFDDESGGHWLVLFQDVSARQELERTKEEFVSMLTHDLRTPLTSIQAYVSMIKDGIYDSDVSAMKQRAGDVGEDADRLIEIISTLLDVYKLEAGRLEMFFDIVPVATIIKRSIRSVSSTAQQRKIAIEVPSIDKSLHVNADENYIIQVLVNLLSNAIKFSDEGTSVLVCVEPDGEQVKFTVSDNGPGVDSELMPRLFNRFEQAKSTDGRTKGGSGLGLAFSRAIVEQHGGTIGVDSVGKGSNFWFTLKRRRI